MSRALGRQVLKEIGKRRNKVELRFQAYRDSQLLLFLDINAWDEIRVGSSANSV